MYSKKNLVKKLTFIVLGSKYAGKTTLAQYMAKQMGYTLIDYGEVNSLTKKKINDAKEKAGEDDLIPEEENAPFDKVEEEVAKLVKELAAKKAKILIDGYGPFFQDTPQEPVPDPNNPDGEPITPPCPKDQQGWFKLTQSLARFGVPEYLLEVVATKETIGERKKVKEEKEELNEDD